MTPVSLVCFAQTARFARRIRPANPTGSTHRGGATIINDAVDAAQNAYYVNPSPHQKLKRKEIALQQPSRTRAAGFPLHCLHQCLYQCSSAFIRGAFDPLRPAECSRASAKLCPLSHTRPRHPHPDARFKGASAPKLPNRFTSFCKSLPALERCACSGRPPGSALPLLPCFLWPCARVRAAWCVTPPPE